MHESCIREIGVCIFNVLGPCRHNKTSFFNCNLLQVHKTEAKNLTADIALSKQKLDNMSAAIMVITDRVNNVELLMDMDISVI